LGVALTLQYLRNLSLVVADPSGTGIELGKLRCVFEVKRGDKQTPNTCDVKAYNLSQTTMNALRATKNGVPEFTQLVLKVSYGTQPPVQIFWGSIGQVRIGREDQKNSYVAFTAADGDESYNYAPTAFTLSAGANPVTPLQRIISDMANFASSSPTQQTTSGQPTTQGYVPPAMTSSTNQSIRGRSFYGNCRDKLRQLAEANDCWYSIQDGQVTFIPRTGYIPEPPVLITPSTGLIGVPEQTQTGLKVKVLLNPNIKIGRTIQLQSTDINQLRYGQDLGSIKTNLVLPAGATKLNADGLYYVMRCDHTGDSRGVPWYSDLTCLAVDATLVPKSVTASTTISNVITRY
jgi:baseplate hub protein gp41